jgi:hypothetical protein
MAMDSFVVQSCIRGHHVYKAIWTPQFGEVLLCRPEYGNLHDLYAVAVVRQGNIVGHIPRKISTICHLFLRHGGEMICQIVGARRYSADLPQGGLEVPCYVTFIGSGPEIDKVKKMLDIASKTKVVADVAVFDDAQSSPPRKKLRQDDVAIEIEDDEEIENSHTCMHGNVWIEFNGHMVTRSDEWDLLHDEKLNDRHINLSQKMLHKQFPETEGLGYTLLQHKTPLVKIARGVQILFVRGNHWIVASNLSCDSSVVKVYDSLYSTVDEETKEVVINLFKCSNDIVLLNTQIQKGGQDCGLFAISIVTALLFGIDIASIRLDQTEMRNHLHSCFTVGQMTPFPMHTL